MGLAGVPGPRAQSSSSEPHRTAHRCSVAPPEISVTKSRTDCALTQQMVGGIKAVSPWLKSASEKLLMGLPTVLAPSGEERTLAAAQWHACGRATVMVLVSSASGPRVSGCPGAPLHFHPYPR